MDDGLELASRIYLLLSVGICGIAILVLAAVWMWMDTGNWEIAYTCDGAMPWQVMANGTASSRRSKLFLLAQK
jgi:hypothetical protein